MAGDYSRKIFNQKKHYSGVLMQQGRVQLDADWNEQLDIQQHRTRTETKDVIGASGVPKKGDSFKIIIGSSGADFTIAPGHIYVGGLLCKLENESPASYLHQPYYPYPDETYFSAPSSPPNSPPESPPGNYINLKDGTYIIYVDAWQREITYLDDPLIQEVALGEADTTTRLQNVWQVKLLQVANQAASCKTTFEEWEGLIAPPTGTLNVKTKEPEDPKDRCILPPSAGYRRLENQLYRVEVQKGGDRNNTSFKWSRDNASVETTIEKIEGNILTVADTGKDEVLSFAGGQWVEIVDEESTLKSSPQKLVQVVSVNPSRLEITISTADLPNKNKDKLKLRRWDQNGAMVGEDGVATATDWIDLEDGIQVLFSEGTYRAGDYWLIPARTATAEVEWPPYRIPNTSPDQQPPIGIDHYFCKLAILQVQSGTITVQDCRPLFPSLTEICAEDICFNNDHCSFPGVENVQEALDMLCSANDLRKHNKYLHGFGVVCGLKMKCRPIRTGITIEKGQAIDCEGNMIEIKNQNGLLYDLVTEAQRNQFLDQGGNGIVCISVAGGPNGIPGILMEKYEPQSFWDTVLEGTLLKDFYDECIESLIKFLRGLFPFPITEVTPVPNEQRRLTAFLNLFAQLINSASGPYGFISGNHKKLNDALGPDEDELLRGFYHDLKERIASETFCAMYDHDDPFPDYILDQGLDTIFGPPLKAHKRLRLHPNGDFAYTCGTNNNIYVYDLKRNELIQISAFPSGANITLEDIAISEDGEELFCVGIINNKDSVFATASIGTAGTISWRATSTIQDRKFVSLGLVARNQLFAVAKMHGLYEIRNIGTAGFSLNQLKAVNATGLFFISNEHNKVIIAVDSNPSGMESEQFSELLILPIGHFDRQETIHLSGNNFSNDITVLDNLVFVTGMNHSGLRVIGGYDISSGILDKNEVELGHHSVVRLSTYSTENVGKYVLMAVADLFKINRFNLNGDILVVDEKFRIPVQLFPTAIVIDERNKKGYVLNSMVNTLTTMNMAEVFHNNPAPDYTIEPPYNLLEYRHGVMEAYKDVLSHLLQYLKDCFCEKFLIDCPECDEDEKVYLGCVEVRQSKVYHICNFSKRKYVKTFRTVEYWLSTLPILPMAKEAFTKFCCTVFDPKGKQ